MVRRSAVVVFFLLPCLIVRSQKVIDSLSEESCTCFEEFLSRSKLPEEDSLTNCITLAIIPHVGTLSKSKKLNPGTVEGVREIHARVRKSLKKKCRVFTGKP
ncbi:MAG: hypothetical protein ACHQFX_04215 [Chitinophagales bacterium]